MGLPTGEIYVLFDNMFTNLCMTTDCNSYDEFIEECIYWLDSLAYEKVKRKHIIGFYYVDKVIKYRLTYKDLKEIIKYNKGVK